MNQNDFFSLHARIDSCLRVDFVPPVAFQVVGSRHAHAIPQFFVPFFDFFLSCLIARHTQRVVSTVFEMELSNDDVLGD